MISFGVIALIAIGGFFLSRSVYEPSEKETSAFLPKLLAAVGRINALGADGSVIRLDAGRIASVDTARCRPDPNEARYGGRYNPHVASRFICHYTVATHEGTRFETVLRANRVPPGGLAEKSVPGSLVDPSRYRVGYFILSPVGLKEAEALLATATKGD